MSGLTLRSSADALAEDVHRRLTRQGVSVELMTLVHVFRAQSLNVEKLFIIDPGDCAKAIYSAELPKEVVNTLYDILEEFVHQEGIIVEPLRGPLSRSAMCTCDDPAAIVMDYLCLGSRETASDKVHLQELGVTHILNVADDVECFFQEEKVFEYCHCKIVDGGRDGSIVAAFATATEFVREAKAANRRVLVHCWAGVNRSATVTMAVLMELEGMTLEQAFEHVSSKRAVHPFPGNKLKIATWEAETRGKCTMPSWIKPQLFY
mmetsp:Transcript_112112/g.215969  ORF Transcript_112112/g.215969 Transcript_112112/m.215969 type:complete len:263 (+) Transcript_112112:40-828(+)